MRLPTILITASLLGISATSMAQNANITVHANEITHQISHYMTGACIEDVNHEVYGGIYSQMIFGEHFQEPPKQVPLKGFTAYGNGWVPRGEYLLGRGGDSPKLLADMPTQAEEEVSVDMLLPNRNPGQSGLILSVREVKPGWDQFQGYDVSLNAERNVVVISRYQNGLEPLESIPFKVPISKWINLSVAISGAKLTVSVDGTVVTTFEDKKHPLPTGKVGIRTWMRDASFRNFRIRTGRSTAELPFEPKTADYDEVSGMWNPVRRGEVSGETRIDTDTPYIGTQSQRIIFKSGQGELGVTNQGLNHWGMHFVKGKPYEGYLLVRSASPATLYVSLESGNGSKTLGETFVTTAGGDWQKLNFTITPNKTVKDGRFVVSLKEIGSVTLGYAFLQPGDWGRFKGLPIRKDVADALVTQGLTVMRYGGCMANAGDYLWKKMTGPRENRPPYRGFWYNYSSNGFAIQDFLNFCEAAGFFGVPDFNLDESPEDMADFIEYANGPAESKWGSIRAADGHPSPYNLKCIEIGNEQRVDDSYWNRFKPIAEAIWKKDPSIILVVGDFSYEQPFDDPYNFKGGACITSLAAHKKILDLAKQYGSEVWFDVHIWTEVPEHLICVAGIPSFIEALGKISPGAKYKVAVFEFNANNHALKRALGNAHAINELERMGDKLVVASSAIALQPYKQNDNGWDQGLLFLSPSQVWGQPPYYVTQMVSRNYLPNCIKSEVESLNSELDVTAKTDKSGKILQLQVVNDSSKPVKTRINIEGFVPTSDAANITWLSGPRETTNTPDQPKRVLPKQRNWTYRFNNGGFSYTFPANSFTIIRLN